MNKGKVYLIGAGPGDPELISIKGLKYLKRADVVIYDNLVNKKLLKNVKNGAEIIYVGKESGHHTLDQEEINKLLIKKAKEGKVVVRLKGGDPFIFGRGGEEALALSENNIEFEIIPGITAATAVPAYAGIPVTHREITSTLAFITGHETPLKEKSHIDWSKISTGIGTLVFFMGIKNLKNIINNLIRHGRDENTPVAIIRWGTLPEQKVITGNLKNIVQIAEKENIKPPAIIIVGDVVKLRDKLNWYESKPLFGKKIVVTRSRSQASKLVELLEEYGAKTIEIPTIRFEYLEESYSLTTAINQIKKFDWLIFTSINGVKSFFKRFFSLKKDIRELANIKIQKVLLTSFFIFIFLIQLLPAQTNEDCKICHADPELTTKRRGRTISLFIDFQKFYRSVHKDLDCIDCHEEANVKEFPHPEELSRVNCGNCHEDVNKKFMASIHGKALKRGAPYAPTCKECHGYHYILPHTDIRSRTYKMNIPVLCGKCHREGAPVARIYNIPEKDILSNYSQSIHGEGLFKKGLIVTATCNDCHGNHLILPHIYKNSSISLYNIAKTCTKCHARIEEVHAKIIKGELWEKEPGAIPACTDCHQPHKIKRTNLVLRTSDRECLKCHQKSEVFKIKNGEKISLKIKKEDIQNSVHRNIPCVKCHADIDPQRARPCETAGRVDCSNCHAQIAENYFESDHGQAYIQNKPNTPYCTDCHGKHIIYSPRDERAKTYRVNIPQLCGECHAKLTPPKPLEISEKSPLIDYSMSVHGQGLIKKGLLPSAICTDCHNTHYILNHKMEESSIYYKNIPATCGSCHQGIYKEYANSVHNISAPGVDKRLPNCEDCHSAHQIKEIRQDQFMREITFQCGSCHQKLSETYMETIHGKAYTLGYLKAAKCSDCHGAHDIRKVDDPNSHVGFNNIVTTCKKCHEDANRKFTGYLTHATHHDKQKYPVLYFTFWAMTSLLIFVFCFFGLHTLLWLPRSFKNLKEKKKAQKSHIKRYYIKRFTTGQRITHIFVILSFMGLALTGMMLKFASMPWAQALANFLGGVEVAGRIHRISAIITFGYFFAHLFSLIRMKIKTKTTWKEMIFGERSLWFNKKDWRDFIDSIKWFLGLGPRPQYGRWTYWEKFDYMAVFWGVGVIGLSGLILWFPEFFTKFLPGWLINVAMIVHSDEALLAVGFIFTIHFFNTHLRPESFPLDPVIFTGLVPLDQYKEERPLEYKYLKESGKLKKCIVSTEINPKQMLLVRIFGFLFLSIGISLILLIIYSMLFGYK